MELRRPTLARAHKEGSVRGAGRTARGVKGVRPARARPSGTMEVFTVQWGPVGSAFRPQERP